VVLRTAGVTGSGCPQGFETLADLGESELIRRLGAFAPAGQFADDAALLSAGGEGALVVNTDVLVEGLHFSEATTAAADVGWRAAAANLSDLAAMGCTEVVGLTVGLVAPAFTPWAWVEGVYGGLRAALDTYGGVLLGGDCSGGAQRILAVTAIGRLGACPGPAGERTANQDAETGTSAAANKLGSSAWAVIRRGDGRPGDHLVCTGAHGLSRLGLALLQGELAGGSAPLAFPSQGPYPAAAMPSPPTAPASATEPDSKTPWDGSWIDPGLSARAISAHRRPRPRFDAVRALIGGRPAALPWRVGGCDSSDGLAAAAAAIAASSGCSARLERTSLPLDPAMAGLPAAEAWCLGGGEDFELVLALNPVWAEALIAALPGATRIGELVEGPAGNLGWSDGRPWPEPSSGIGGFQHFG
jgi:thiamine-monophosphate kinase